MRLVNAADAQMIASEVFDNRCAATGSVDNLALRRLDRGQLRRAMISLGFFLKRGWFCFSALPASISNIVLLSESAARRHDKGENVFGGEAQVAAIARKLQALVGSN